MTYCVAALLEKGLVFTSDSRTNAGVDYVTSCSKLHIISPSPDRLFVLMSAGNLATTQQVINYIKRDLAAPPNGVNLMNANYMFEAAEYIGRLSVNIQSQYGAALQATGVSGEATLILGGQIQGQPHELMLIYPQGNHISATASTPYLQIGENKYGKPILDRLARVDMDLEEAARMLLVSMEATARSNAAVGPPYEVAIYHTNALALSQQLSLAEGAPYFSELKLAWNNALREGFRSLPKFDWEH